MKVVLIMLLYVSRITSFIIPPILTPNNNILRRSITSSSSLFTSFHQNQLEKLTVVKLRSIIKELYPHISTSKLRLKQDLITFLVTNHLNERNKGDTSTTNNDSVITTTRSPKSPSVATKIRNGASTTSSKTRTRQYSTTTKKKNIKKPLKMPSLVNTSPKKDYFENQILYPGMDLTNTPSDKPVNEDGDEEKKEDIRTTYHPIFTSLPSQTSDFDISFIGTASCVPSITRGSSCTALRLNWRRGNDGRDHNPNNINSDFKSGTWLFDCGECTQVSSIF